MAYYLDLAECDYFGVEHASQLFAVGWLSHGKQFRMGSVAKGCFDKLKNLLKDPWQPSFFRASITANFANTILRAATQISSYPTGLESSSVLS